MFTELKLFLETGKGLLYIGFAILFLFLFIGSRCHHEPPKVTVIETPVVAGTVAKVAIDNFDKTIQDNKQAEQKTDNKVDEVKIQLHDIVKKIKKDTTKTAEQKETAVASAQIDSLNSIYYNYYPKPVITSSSSNS